MALLGNTFTTYSAVGLREDLSDIIYNISPTETPFMTGIAREKATAVYHEWQPTRWRRPTAPTRRSRATTSALTTRWCRLFAWQLLADQPQDGHCLDDRGSGRQSGQKERDGLSGRQEGEIPQARHRDHLLSNQARAVGTVGATPAKCASVLAWLKTNVSNVVAGGANPAGDGTNARTDGTTPVALTEAMLQTALASIWTNSGDEPEMVLVNSSQKTKISGFPATTPGTSMPRKRSSSTALTYMSMISAASRSSLTALCGPGTR